MFDLFRDPSGKRKVLRPHQVAAIDMLRSSLGRGNRRVVVQMPTGAGKTLMSARIIETSLAKGNRVIFTVPYKALVDQTVAAFEAEGIRDIGVMQSNHVRTDSTAKVQVATVQTMRIRGIPEAALVIVDECHLDDPVLDQMMDEKPNGFFVGLSATPWRKGMGLRWQDLVIPCDIESLIEAGLLSQFSVYAPDVPDLSGVKVNAGEYAEGQLAEVMGEAKIMGNVVENWLARGQGRPTLAFGVNLAHAEEMHAAFLRAGIASAYVKGKTDLAERAGVNEKFRSGEIRVICSCKTMIAGVDLPVSCIIDAAPTRSEMSYVQRIGRGLRVNPGTEDCTVFDHAGNALRLGLVTDIRHEALDDTKPGQRAPAEPKAEKLPKPCPKCEVLFSGRECPQCGHERKPPKLETAEGELVEITGRKPKVTTAQKDERFAMLLWIARNRGFKPGWAFHKYLEWHGVRPRNGFHPKPTPPSAEVQNWVTSREIAWRASKARARS